MAFTILRQTGYRRMPWKNGLGETAEVAIEPADAVLDAFDWRVSMARVVADGPFSAFRGVDRTLTILDGAGLRLSPSGCPPVDLGRESEPYSFAGDVACAATLRAGPVTDLNVMSRRDRCWHRVRRLGPGPVIVDDDLAATFLVCAASGPVEVRAAGTPVVLGPLDSLRLGPGTGTVEVTAATRSGLLLVEIGSRS